MNKRLSDSTISSERKPRLVITVHGIRTFGLWQEKLEERLRANRDLLIEVCHYRYGFFTVIAFLIPPLRWLATRRFYSDLRRQISQQSWSRIDIVAHSFGTHLVGWSVLKLPPSDPPAIHTVIFAGSVLKSSFPIRSLLQRVGRLVNDCGVSDQVLLANQLFVLFTGMAGRIGFAGMEGDHFRNRYFRFGHSGYFDATAPDFITQFWIPLLLYDKGIPSHDERKPSKFYDLIAILLNNAEPIKLACYIAPLALALAWVNHLRLDAQNKAKQLAAAESKIRQDLVDTQRSFTLSLFRNGKPVDALRQLVTLRRTDSMTLGPDLTLLYRFWLPRATAMSSLLPPIPSEVVFRCDSRDYFRDSKGRLWDLGYDDIMFWSTSNDNHFALFVSPESMHVRDLDTMALIMTMDNAQQNDPLTNYAWSDVTACGPSQFCVYGNTVAATIGRELGAKLQVDPVSHTHNVATYSSSASFHSRYRSSVKGILTIAYPSLTSERSLYRATAARPNLSFDHWTKVATRGNEDGGTIRYTWNDERYRFVYAVYGAASTMALWICQERNVRECVRQESDEGISLEYLDYPFFLMRNFLMIPAAEEGERAPSVFLYDLARMHRVQLAPLPTGDVDGEAGVAVSSSSDWLAVVEDRSAEDEELDFGRYLWSQAGKQNSDGAVPAVSNAPDVRSASPRIYISLYRSTRIADRYERQWLIKPAQGPVTAIQFVGDDVILVAFGSVVEAYQVRENRKLWTQQVGFRRAVRNIVQDGEGRCAAVYNAGEIVLIDTVSGIPLSNIFEAKHIKAVSWQSDGSVIAEIGSKTLVRDAPLSATAPLRVPFTDDPLSQHASAPSN